MPYHVLTGVWGVLDAYGQQVRLEHLPTPISMPAQFVASLVATDTLLPLLQSPHPSLVLAGVEVRMCVGVGVGVQVGTSGSADRADAVVIIDLAGVAQAR